MHPLTRALRLQRQIPIRPRLNRPVQRRAFYHKPQDNGRFQAVRFVKSPIWTLRRIATFGLYGGAVYAYLHLVWRYLDIEIEYDEGLEETDANDEFEEEEDSAYVQEDSLFIPLTWTTKLPRAYYRGSDPEWQEFIKIDRDKERQGKIYKNLAEIMASGSIKHPGISQRLGKNIALHKYWLEIQFPPGPPQEYVWSGIEIGDGFIAWSDEKISQEQYWRLTRALWPQAAFSSLWASTQVLVGIQYRRVKQALGLEAKDPFSPEERYRHALEMMRKQQEQKNGLGKARIDPTANAGSVASGAPDDRASRPYETGAGKLPWQIPVPLPSVSATDNSDIPVAMHVFSSTLSKHWNPKKMEPPRGTILISGIIEVRGNKGRVLYDIQSCYDPKTSKFVLVNAAVRNFKRWHQGPRGGS